jgi:CBS domain containing-hemolysin-like protein
MMELFRSSRRHLAVIIDANEAMLGIVTFEDVLEEIVGEIRDELDIERGPIFEQTENSIVVDASLPLRELRAETGWNFEYQPRENVGAWVTRLAGRTLQREESIRLGEYEITALQTHASGLRRVRITRSSAEELKALQAGEKAA